MEILTQIEAAVAQAKKEIELLGKGNIASANRARHHLDSVKIYAQEARTAVVEMKKKLAADKKAKRDAEKAKKNK